MLGADSGFVGCRQSLLNRPLSSKRKSSRATCSSPQMSKWLCPNERCRPLHPPKLRPKTMASFSPLPQGESARSLRPTSLALTSEKMRMLDRVWHLLSCREISKGADSHGKSLSFCQPSFGRNLQPHEPLVATNRYEHSRVALPLSFVLQRRFRLRCNCAPQSQSRYTFAPPREWP